MDPVGVMEPILSYEGNNSPRLPPSPGSASIDHDADHEEKSDAHQNEPIVKYTVETSKQEEAFTTSNLLQFLKSDLKSPDGGDLISHLTKGNLTFQRFTTNISDVSIINSRAFVGVNLAPPASVGNDKSPAKELEPFSTVPFERDLNFVGRESILTKLKAAFAPSDRHKRAALYGLGGVGKSQIAIEYAHILRLEDPSIWVFWVHAGSVARFTQSYQDLASELELANRDDPSVNVLQIVSEWLKDGKNGRWLMILDNADNSDIFWGSTLIGEAQSGEKADDIPPLAIFVPQSSNGSVLVTSRDKKLALELTRGLGDIKHIIPVPTLTEKDALLLLEKSTGFQGAAKDDAEALIRNLDLFPLAISQAAAYINEGAPSMTVTKYNNLFKQQEANQIRLLNEGVKNLNDPAIPNSVINTWSITFRRVEELHQGSMILLSLMSVLDGHSIPEFMIRGDDDSESMEFEDIVNPLIRYSLVKHIEGPSFQLHSLVQLATRRMLATKGTLDDWKLKGLFVVASLFPNGEYGQWDRCKSLEPHAELVLQYEITGTEIMDTERLELRAMLLFNVASFMMSRGNSNAALERAQESLQISRNLNDQYHHSFSILNLLGGIYRDLGQYTKAEELCREAFEGSQNLNGDDHRTTIACANYLAQSLNEQAKYEEARVLAQFAYDHMKTTEDENIETLNLAAGLAESYSRVGENDRAVALMQKTLESSERVLGDEHPVTLGKRSEVASLLSYEGKYEAADILHQSAIKGAENTLGPEHKDTMAMISGWASSLQSQGRFEEASKLSEVNLERSKKSLGENHPSTFICANDLASAYVRLNKKAEAETLYERALNGQISTLGLIHPHTLATLHNLGSFRAKQKRYGTLDEYLRKAVADSKTTLSAEHPRTLETILMVSKQFGYEGRYEEQDLLLRENLILKSDPPSTNVLETTGVQQNQEQNRQQSATSINTPTEQVLRLQLQLWDSFGHAVLILGKLDDMPMVCREILAVWDAYPGPKGTLGLVETVPMALLRNGRTQEAEEVAKQWVHDKEIASGKEIPSLAGDLNSLALILSVTGKNEEAEQVWKRELAIREKFFGPDDHLIATCLVNLASCLESQRKYADAEDFYHRGLAMRKRTLSINNDLTLSTISAIASLYYGQGKMNEAEDLYRQLSQRSEQKFGLLHERTLTASQNLIAILEEQGKTEEADQFVNDWKQKAARLRLANPQPDIPSTGPPIQTAASSSGSDNNEGEQPDAGGNGFRCCVQ